MPSEQKFVFVITAYNVRPFLGALIASLAFQRYAAWNAVFIDDASTDGTLDTLRSLLADHGLNDKFKVVENHERGYKAQNVYRALSEHGTGEDVMVMLDGDDHLAVDHALDRLAQEYDQGWEVVWSNWRGTDGRRGSSSHLNPFLRPRQQPFVSSHLFSFRRRLFDCLDPQDLQDNSGQWLKCACDVALALPILDQTIKRRHIEDVLLVYNRSNPLSHGGSNQASAVLSTVEQAAVSRMLCRRRPKPLTIDRRFLHEHLYEFMQAATLSSLRQVRRATQSLAKTRSRRA